MTDLYDVEVQVREQWEEIPEFFGYSVSDHGRVRNDDTKRILTLLVNQSGLVNVGLTRGRVQYKRSVALLVAKAFLEPPMDRSFNTPINLDGDRRNNAARNLVWRPRWFAAKYNSQMRIGHVSLRMTIEDVRTGERFRNTKAAAVRFGLLERDIADAIANRTYVWPTYQTFRIVPDER